MTNKALLTIMASCAIMLACQKEPDAELTPPDPPAEATRLESMVYQLSATDSSITDLLYDAGGRFVGFDAPGGDPLLGGYTACRITRNQNGLIQSFTIRDQTATGMQETAYQVFYDAARRQYAYRVANTQFNGITLRDSTTFDYANNRLSASRFLIREPQSGLTDTVGKYEFTYDGAGNLSKVGTLALDSATGNLQPFVDLLMEYDGKINPLALGAEGVVLDQLFFVSPANFTKVSIRDAGTPVNPVPVFQVSYTYRADNRPEGATVQGDGASFAVKFRYN